LIIILSVLAHHEEQSRSCDFYHLAASTVSNYYEHFLGLFQRELRNPRSLYAPRLWNADEIIWYRNHAQPGMFANCIGMGDGIHFRLRRPMFGQSTYVQPLSEFTTVEISYHHIIFCLLF
jgi:hypothetical protein